MRSIRKFTSSILSLVIISTFCAALSGCLTNYLQLIQYVRNIGDVHQPYANTTEFPESADHRHMNNIGSIFDCYEIE